MKDLVDIHFPNAVLISVVLDNLNTHTPAARLTPGRWVPGADVLTLSVPGSRSLLMIAVS
jgi:hypothetical protein